ncbi:benenodin family lasso peptide [Sandaracinobacter neustonicus]|uniref:Benenodin family lasso peptide n=1 Tax=Sandaracinobacter neustonicus TaxID=1715348 RepID=A0A501XGT7_9SPHN|nr:MULTISPECIES: benenodin family lasso peptide [Alphaproteobacteria]TPE59760.1 benenodin family lasso peptide [Sandaracinobacter neustonicus]
MNTREHFEDDLIDLGAFTDQTKGDTEFPGADIDNGRRPELGLSDD